MNPAILAATNPVVIYAGVGALFVLLVVIGIFQTKCPKCGKVFGKKTLSRTAHGGNRYTAHNECKSCGHKWDTEHTRSQKHGGGHRHHH